MKAQRPDLDFAAEHAKFGDYWRAKAGRDATKMDWDATWRNWMRNARVQANGGTVRTFRQQADDQQAQAALARARERDAQRSAG